MKPISAATVHNVTLVFLVLDVGYITTFVFITMRAIMRQNEVDQTDGFLALASPHTAIIPTLVTILSAARAAALDKSQQHISSVDAGWFLAPVLAVPFDILEVAQSWATKPYSAHSTGVFICGCIISISISIFTTIVFFDGTLRANKRIGNEIHDTVRVLSESTKHAASAPGRGGGAPAASAAARRHGLDL
jgi:hypothetical protein